MLLAEKRKRQEVAGKVNHPEYIYQLNGQAHAFEDAAKGRGREQAQAQAGRPSRFPRDQQVRPPPFAVDDDRGAKNGFGGHPQGLPSEAGGAAPGGNGPSPLEVHMAPQDGRFGGPPQAVPRLYYGPTLPPLSAPSSSPLPGPLPPIYHPKPPLIFHPSSFAEGADGVGAPLHRYGLPLAAVPTIELSPVKPTAPALFPTTAGAGLPQRPFTSPPVLPALQPRQGGDDPTPGPQQHPQRRGQSASAVPAPGLGGAGGLFGAGGGLSEQEEKLREKLAARQRALELQEENARQIAEHAQRKAAQKAKEAAEAQEEEARLRREREERARREQEEVDREERERQAKMLGPKAAQALLAQQQEAERKRKEEEALAKQKASTPEQSGVSGRAEAEATAAGAAGPNRSSAPDVPSRSTTPPAPPLPQPLVQGFAQAQPPPLQSQPPLTSWLHSQPVAQPQLPALHLAPLPSQPYYYAGALGSSAAVSRPTAAASVSPPLAVMSAAELPQAPLYTYEAENLKRELREIAANQRHLEQLLEARVLSAAPLASGTSSPSAVSYLRSGAAAAVPASTSASVPSPATLSLGGGAQGRATLSPLVSPLLPGTRAESTARGRAPLEEGVVWKTTPTKAREAEEAQRQQQQRVRAEVPALQLIPPASTMLPPPPPSLLDGLGLGMGGLLSHTNNYLPYYSDKSNSNNNNNNNSMMNVQQQLQQQQQHDTSDFVDRDLTLSTHLIYAGGSRRSPPVTATHEAPVAPSARRTQPEEATARNAGKETESVVRCDDNSTDSLSGAVCQPHERSATAGPNRDSPAPSSAREEAHGPHENPGLRHPPRPDEEADSQQPAKDHVSPPSPAERSSPHEL